MTKLQIIRTSAFCTGTDPAQEELQGQVDQQQELGRQGVQDERHYGIGDGQACRSGVIAHGDVLCVRPQRAGNFNSAAGVGAVEHAHGEEDDKQTDKAQPVGHPFADGDVQLPHGHHLRRAPVSTIMPALSSFMSSAVASTRSMRTGMRCCTFTKLPAELSVGTREYFDPVASDMAVTVP